MSENPGAVRWQHLIGGIEMDLNSARAKFTELRAELSSLNLPEPTQHRCDPCGIVFRGPLSLAEHMYLTHDGPDPEHWVQAEKLADNDRPKA